MSKNTSESVSSTIQVYLDDGRIFEYDVEAGKATYTKYEDRVRGT